MSRVEIVLPAWQAQQALAHFALKIKSREITVPDILSKAFGAEFGDELLWAVKQVTSEKKVGTAEEDMATQEEALIDAMVFKLREFCFGQSCAGSHGNQ